MTLTAATLAGELEGLEPTDSEATAISVLVAAWEVYFDEATVLETPINAGSYSSALSAMQGAMTGLSLENNAATAIHAGVVAFWGALDPLAESLWTFVPPIPPGTAVTPPAGIAGLAVALQAVFASILASKADLPTAAADMADAMHSANAGGILVIPPPPPPTNPGPQPIT